MEVEACYNYGFLPADRDRGRGRGRHQPPPPPPPHPAEDGEMWEYFPCPFCYIEVEVPFICSHLQEEHCFDTRNAVCPICANNLGRDMAAHFRVEHWHLLKRRKPSKPCAWPAAASATYECEEEPQQHYRRPYQEQEPAPDPLLSHFICTSVEQHDAENVTPDTARCTRKADDASSKLGLQERLQRIDFLTEILMSTIL